MDPNANLNEQRRIVAHMRANKYPDAMSPNELRDHAYAADRLVDLAEALDEWIRKGGALPDEWRK